MDTIWQDLKNHIRPELPKKSFSLWMDPLTLMENQKDTLVLGCPNKFSKKWIMENYLGIMEKKLSKIDKGQYKLTLKVKPLYKKKVVTNHNDFKQLPLPSFPANGKGRNRLFNNEYTFDRFVVGKCNAFAYSVSKSLTLGSNCPYNSLFLLSNTGLGKSHLSQAIGHATLKENPHLKVHYLTAENFVNEMIFSLKNNRIDEFKNKYRRCCDVLLLEEIHFFGGKEKMQIELEHTLDALANDHKKLIFTSALLPKDIPNMNKQLASRLTSGIITSLEKPDYKTRVKIIENKSAEQNLLLSEEIVDLLAKFLSRDIRQIESALNCLKANSELMKAKIDMDLAKNILKSYISESESTSTEDILKLICQYFKTDPLILRSKSRQKIHTYPRNLFIYLCRRYTDATLENIGQTIQRNHSSVLYAAEIIEKKIRVDNQVKKQVDFLCQKLEESIK